MDGSSLVGVLSPVHQHYLLEARQMQAMSFIAHIPLVCFGVAMPLMVLFVEWIGIRTGDHLYTMIARRWSRLVLALFAVGVITGTILSFEMGMLWPNFTATFGSVFGLGFAIEGFSFFMEAIFVGVYAYSWGKIRPRLHLLCGVPIVITGFTGSLMVIAVNAWMNHPSGFKLRHGKVYDVNPLHALFANSYLWSELIHMYIAAYMVVGFLVAGWYAFCRLRGRWTRYERVAMTIPLTIACLAAPVQVLVGDWLARNLAVDQPVKLAAFEGLYKTTRGASEHLFGWYSHNQLHDSIPIPHLLSLLAFHSWDGTVKGLQIVPPSQRPPINIPHYCFDIMVGVGMGLATLGVFFIAVWLRYRRLPNTKWFYLAMLAAGPGAFLALIAGWVAAEVGRQPWIVYHVMTVNQAVTGASGIPIGDGVLFIVYLLVVAAVVWILRRLARSPLDALEDVELEPPGRQMPRNPQAV